MVTMEPPLRDTAPDPDAKDSQDFFVWKEVETWANGLPGWQRWIVRLTADAGRISAADLEVPWALLLRDSGLSSSDAELPSVPSLAVQTTSSREVRWKLREVRDLTHVNAITERAVLPIGDSLTVVYGANGSGKSGFARLLASVCFSRGRVRVLPNVHADAPDDAVVDASIVLSTSGDGADVTVRVAELNACREEIARLEVLDASASRREHADRVTSFRLFRQDLVEAQAAITRAAVEARRLLLEFADALEGAAAESAASRATCPNAARAAARRTGRAPCCAARLGRGDDAWS